MTMKRKVEERQDFVTTRYPAILVEESKNMKRKVENNGYGYGHDSCILKTNVQFQWVPAPVESDDLGSSGSASASAAPQYSLALVEDGGGRGYKHLFDLPPARYSAALVEDGGGSSVEDGGGSVVVYEETNKMMKRKVESEAVGSSSLAKTLLVNLVDDYQDYYQNFQSLLAPPPRYSDGDDDGNGIVNERLFDYTPPSFIGKNTTCYSHKLPKGFCCRDLLFPRDSDDDHYLLLSKDGCTKAKDRVELDSLRGNKFLLLYFDDLTTYHSSPPVLSSSLSAFYHHLKRTRPNTFEMLFVAITPPYDIPFQQFTSTLPFPFIPFHLEAWRTHLSSSLLETPHTTSQITILDIHGNLVNQSALTQILTYGPHLYPFTPAKELRLEIRYDRFIKETSLMDLLASPTRDYLINRREDKVPISQLESHDVVALFTYHPRYLEYSPFLEQLVAIYTNLKQMGKTFEIVFINLIDGDGFEDCQSFRLALQEMPWLALPFQDEKSWILTHLLANGNPPLSDDEEINETYTHPMLAIKAKGEPLLDMYGYFMIRDYGQGAYPFTRRAVLTSEINKLRMWTIESLAEKALGLLDFSSLIPPSNSIIKAAAGEPEEQVVPLSAIWRRGEGKGLVLMFLRKEGLARHYGSEEALTTLTKAYLDQDNSSFEVIFVSLDHDDKSFHNLFSAMPWYACKKRLDKDEEFVARTLKFDFISSCHFITFGPDGFLLRAGYLPKSFENRDFPFISNYEFMKEIALKIQYRNGWDWSDAELDTFIDKENCMVGCSGQNL